MSTPAAPEQENFVATVLSDLGSDDLKPERARSRWLLWLILVCAAAGAGLFGYTYFAGDRQAKAEDQLLTYKVVRDDFLATVTDEGTVESARNQDIRCEMEGGSTILSIVDDGKEVKEGEELARLDSSQVEDKISQQRIAVEKARATFIQATKDYEVTKIAVREYIEGTFPQSLEKASADIAIAKANLVSAQNSFDYTKRIFEKGYSTQLQVDAQKLAVERAQLDLNAANTAKKVLEDFTKAKTLQDLESKRDTAEAKKAAEKASFDLEDGRLKRLENQLKKCVIKAPRSGLVVYANEQARMRFGPQQASEIKEGATVREQQAIFRLPDLTKMQVKAMIHESKIDRVRPRQRARIRVQDREFQGEVVSVANQPEPPSFTSSAKKYATVVRIEGDTKDLRPGSTAEIEILIAKLEKVVSVPVAAVFEEDGKTFAGVKDGDRVEKREVTLGLSNDKAVEITKGLQPDSVVVLNVRSLLAAKDKSPTDGKKVDVEKRFGKGDPNGGKFGANGPGAPGAVAGPGAPGIPGGPGGRMDPSGAKGGVAKGAAGKARFDPMQMWDTNKDGKLSREELVAAPPLQAAFDEIDTNHDKFVSRAELNAYFAKMPRPGGGAGGGPGGPGGGGPQSP